MTMNVTCKDRERIFEDGTAAEWSSLEAHAAGCAACAEEVRAWKSLSVAAKELQDYSANPELWVRIERSLIQEDARKAQRAQRSGKHGARVREGHRQAGSGSEAAARGSGDALDGELPRKAAGAGQRN